MLKTLNMDLGEEIKSDIGNQVIALLLFLFVLLAKVGDKPLLVTEFGAEAMLELHGDNYGTEDEQASIIADHWQVFQEFRDSIPGALIWSLADYWHMPMSPDFSWGVNRYYFCHGVLTLDRFPKKAVEMAGRLFQSIARET